MPCGHTRNIAPHGDMIRGARFNAQLLGLWNGHQLNQHTSFKGCVATT